MGHQILCASLLGARSQHSDCFPSPGYDAQGPFLPATGCSGCPHLGRGVFWSHVPGHIKGAHAPACVCVCVSQFVPRRDPQHKWKERQEGDPVPSPPALPVPWGIRSVLPIQ